MHDPSLLTDDSTNFAHARNVLIYTSAYSDGNILPVITKL